MVSMFSAVAIQCTDMIWLPLCILVFTVGVKSLLFCSSQFVHNLFFTLGDAPSIIICVTAAKCAMTVTSLHTQSCLVLNYFKFKLDELKCFFSNWKA